MNLDAVREALLTVGVPVKRYEMKNKRPPYIVWAEDGAGESLYGNNRVVAQVISGFVDYYTTEDGDANVDKIQAALSIAGIDWVLLEVSYDDLRLRRAKSQAETEVICYSWAWEIITP